MKLTPEEMAQLLRDAPAEATAMDLAQISGYTYDAVTRVARRMGRVLKRKPWNPWSAEEQAQLMEALHRGISIRAVARQLQRPLSSVRNRVALLTREKLSTDEAQRRIADLMAEQAEWAAQVKAQRAPGWRNGRRSGLKIHR